MSTLKLAVFVVQSALLLATLPGCEGTTDPSNADGDTDTDTDTDGDGDTDSDSDGDSDSDSDSNDGCDKMDILFVIDNSGSMGHEQTNLIANFAGFIEALDEYEVGGTGGQLDYHVGVTSTDVDHNECTPLGCPLEEGEDGVLQNTPLGNGGACDAPAGLFMTGPSNEVVDQFACVAELGTGGWSNEMPLEAIRRGMTDGISGEGHINTENAGFLREDALFVAIIITDEDDESLANTYWTGILEQGNFTPGPLNLYVSDSKGFLSIKPSYEYMVFGVISGPEDSSCSSTFGDASETPRLHEFLSMTGSYATWANICDGDLAGAFATILDSIELACSDMPPIE